MSYPVRILVSLLLFCCFNFSNAQLSLNSITFPDKIEEGKFQFYSINKDGEDHHEYYSCTWDMDDGTRRVMLNQFSMGYAFRDDGSYLITFNAKDSEGQVVSISQQVKVVNLPPEVRFLDGKIDNSLNRRVKFEAIAYDPGSDELTYTWDFGDGNTQEGRQSSNIMHTYDEPGVYTVRVTVDDGDGGSDYKEMTMSVENDWYAAITGDYNFNLSGGAGLMYQTRIDTITGEIVRCLKMFTFYDDNNNSFLNVGTNTLKRLAGETHNIGHDHKRDFMVILRHDLKPSLYANMSSWFRTQEVREDHRPFTGKSMQALTLMPDMLEAIRTGENIFGLNFEEVSGSIEIEPIRGDRLKGKMTALLEGSVKGADGVSVKKLINIDLVFNVRVNKIAKYHMEHGCEEVADPFFITDYSPRDGKVNVNTENACIEVGFSEAVDPLSVTAGNIQLGYYNSLDEFIIEDMGIDHIEGNRIQIIPGSKLRSGVIYEVKIKNGIDGIRSLNGGELELDEHWKFSTIVQPRNLKARVYQTIADAPLIEGKNTMVRVQVFWDKPIDVGDRSFVKEFPGSVYIKSKRGNTVCSIYPFIFNQQDSYTDDDKRMALNSANVYGWEPKKSDGDPITIEVIPDYQECIGVDEKEKYEIKHSVTYWDLAPELKVDCYLFKAMNWREGIPPVDLSIVNEFVEKNELISKQIFPIKDIKINVIETAMEIDPNHVDGVSGDQMIEYFKVLSLESSADIIVVFTADGLKGGYAKSWLKEPSLNLPYNGRFVQLHYVSEILPRALLAHEIGHTLSLEHVPYVVAEDDRAFVASQPFDTWENVEWHRHIDGFRINLNGRNGYNKSCDEGNEQSSEFCSLMFPTHTNVFYNTFWLDLFQYLKVYNHLRDTKYRISFNDSKRSAYNWVSIDQKNPEFKKYKTIYLSGIYDKSKGEAFIDFARKAESKNSIHDDVGGYLVVNCLDAEGKVIAKNSFNPETETSTCFPKNESKPLSFLTHIEVPEESRPKLITIVEKGKLLAEYSISENAPSIDLLTPSINDTLSGNIEINWEAKDTDNDDLIYSLYYTSGDLNDWQMKGITKEEKMILNASNFTSGPSPAFKVVASDGFHESEAIVPVHIDFSFEIERIDPKNKAEVADDIKIVFSNAVMPSSDANQWFKFLSRDSLGLIRKIDYEVEYADDYKSITLLPHHNLDQSLEYRISYGIKPPAPVVEDSSDSKKEAKKRKRPLKDFLAKQVDKVTADDENEENSNFLKDVLGLPTKEVPKKEEVKEEKRNVIVDMLGLNDKVEEEIYLIKDVFGNELKGYYYTQFKIFL